MPTMDFVPQTRRPELQTGMLELLGSNAEECLRLAKETENPALRHALRNLAEAYLDRARALGAPVSGRS